MTKFLCPHCTVELNRLTSFCSACGGKIPAGLEPVRHHCHACGYDLNEPGRLYKSNYCSQCGARVNSSEEHMSPEQLSELIIGGVDHLMIDVTGRGEYLADRLESNGIKITRIWPEPGSSGSLFRVYGDGLQDDRHHQA